MSKQNHAKLAPWIAGLAIIALVAFLAVPSLAAPTGTKYFRYSVAPTSVETGTTPVFKVTITNTSPKQSSSNISSVSIVVPRPIHPSVGGRRPSSTNGTAGTVAYNGAGSTNCVMTTGPRSSVCSISPVKAQQKVVIAITATVNATVACNGRRRRLPGL